MISYSNDYEKIVGVVWEDRFQGLAELDMKNYTFKPIIELEELNKCASETVKVIKSEAAFKKSMIIGPTDPSVSKVKDYYRKLVYIKNANYDILLNIQKKIEESLGNYRNVGAIYDFN